METSTLTKSQYCLECGTLLEKKPEPTRETTLEHLRYGFDVTVKRPKIFYQPF